MSMVHRLIDQLEQRGLRIAPGTERGTLLLYGPDKEKTPEVMDAVKKFKPHLLKIYQPEAEPGESQTESPTEEQKPADADDEGEPCPECQAWVYTHSAEVQRMCHRVMCPRWEPGVGPEWLADERRREEYRRGKAEAA